LPASGGRLAEWTLRGERHNAHMAERLAALTQARGLLMLLIATCEQTLLALEAAANELDTEMTADVKAMIRRSEHELEALNAKITAAEG
jgi:hypothetical protein